MLIPLIPLYRPERKELFVDAALLAPETVILNGIRFQTSFETSALKFDTSINLISVSQYSPLDGPDHIHSDDTLSSIIRLSSVVLQIDGRVVKCPLSDVFADVQFVKPERSKSPELKLLLKRVLSDDPSRLSPWIPVLVTGVINQETATCVVHLDVDPYHPMASSAAHVIPLGYTLSTYRVTRV